MERSISLNLRGEVITLDMDWDQWRGLETFIQCYNGVNFGVREAVGAVLAEELDLENIPLYSLVYPMDGYFPDPQRRDDLKALIKVAPQIWESFPDWNEHTLQGFITGAKWVGVNWRDYIIRVYHQGRTIEVTD